MTIRLLLALLISAISTDGREDHITQVKSFFHKNILGKRKSARAFLRPPTAVGNLYNLNIKKNYLILAEFMQ